MFINAVKRNIINGTRISQENSDMNIYDFSMLKADGAYRPLSDYRGKTVLIVNTASKCGFTKQFAGLEALYKKFKDKGFVILAFPCNQFLKQDPGTNEEIQNFCKVNFGVTFPVFAKIDVRGKTQNPLYNYLTKESGPDFKGAIKWNFTKFLIDATLRPSRPKKSSTILPGWSDRRFFFENIAKNVDKKKRTGVLSALCLIIGDNDHVFTNSF